MFEQTISLSNDILLHVNLQRYKLSIMYCTLYIYIFMLSESVSACVKYLIGDSNGLASLHCRVYSSVFLDFPRDVPSHIHI